MKPVLTYAGKKEALGECLDFVTTIDGILQDPDLEALRSAVQTLLNGGRVLNFKPRTGPTSTSDHPLSMGQWLLVSGLLERHSCLPRNIKSVVVDTSEEVTKVIAQLGEAKVAHQVWQKI